MQLMPMIFVNVSPSQVLSIPFVVVLLFINPKHNHLQLVVPVGNHDSMCNHKHDSQINVQQYFSDTFLVHPIMYII